MYRSERTYFSGLDRGNKTNNYRHLQLKHINNRVQRNFLRITVQVMHVYVQVPYVCIYVCVCIRVSVASFGCSVSGNRTYRSQLRLWCLMITRFARLVIALSIFDYRHHAMIASPPILTIPVHLHQYPRHYNTQCLLSSTLASPALLVLNLQHGCRSLNYHTLLLLSLD